MPKLPEKIEEFVDKLPWFLSPLAIIEILIGWPHRRRGNKKNKHGWKI